MIRIVLHLLLAGLSAFQAQAQQRAAAAPAMLLLTGLNSRGEEVTAQSQDLVVLYESGLAKGELAPGRLSSSDTTLNAAFSSMTGKQVTFTVAIPEGMFTFGSKLEQVFDARGELAVDGYTSEFDIRFTVSNFKTTDQNTFQVIGQGRLSLSEHLNLHDAGWLDDSFAFLFTQNLRTFTP